MGNYEANQIVQEALAGPYKGVFLADEGYCTTTVVKVSHTPRDLSVIINRVAHPVVDPQRGVEQITPTQMGREVYGGPRESIRDRLEADIRQVQKAGDALVITANTTHPPLEKVLEELLIQEQTRS